MSSSIRVWIIDPDEQERLHLRKALRGREARFRITESTRLRDLPDALAGGAFDIALIDLDGWPQPFEALDQVRAQLPDLPIIVLSQTDHAGPAVQRGADGFVMKT